MTHSPHSTRKVGGEAEAAACAYLEAKGLRVVDRNVRTRRGEIDVLARDGDVLVFVEVRYREEDGLGAPEETVGRAKRLRVVSAARAFLADIPASSWKEARFDVVAVTGNLDAPRIHHIPGAFDAKGKIL